jgi:hypothetical protein
LRLEKVWVVEGGFGTAAPEFAAFQLRVEPAGWTLTDAEEPTVERLWTWDSIGGLEVVRGAGKTPDGRLATALDVIVNGWPVRVLVPTGDLPNETIAMLGAFAPVGHPLRTAVMVRREPAWQRFSETSRRFAGDRGRWSPVFLRSPGTSGVRAAVVVGLVLVATVVAASIAGVATSAQTTTSIAGRNTATSGVTDPAPASTGVNPSAGAPTTGATTTPTTAAVAPAVAAASASSTTTRPAAKKSSTKSTTTTTKAKKATTTKSPTTTKAPGLTPTGPAPTSPTPTSPTPTSPTPTSPTPTNATTTTTRPRRPPPTTTSPTTTTTRGRRNPGGTTTTTTSTEPPVISIPLP